jgi:hypothetical protein
MNCQQLKIELEANEIDSEAYYIGSGFPNEKYVLARETDGRWSVYFSERGERAGNRFFHSESDACSFFLKRVLRDPTTRRKK